MALLCEFRVQRVSTRVSGSHLVYGEQVYLESAHSRGRYLTVKQLSGGTHKLTTTSSIKERCSFALHSPTLLELVQLHATAVPPALPLSLDEQEAISYSRLSNASPEFELEELRLEAERERKVMEAIAKNLPLDLAIRIFEYKPDWIRTARLCCKSWKFAAEKNIRRIRVNGEFCSLETKEERENLIAFVRRCPSLEVLTLRNVMTLDDEDVAKITENRNLVRLILGGCRRLSDRSTREIANKLGNLNHLNMAFTSITDESLSIVASSVDHLKELNLYNCTGVTVEGINRTVHGLQELEHINLRGTVVDSQLVQPFKRQRPEVVVLTGPASADSIWG